MESYNENELGDGSKTFEGFEFAHTWLANTVHSNLIQFLVSLLNSSYLIEPVYTIIISLSLVRMEADSPEDIKNMLNNMKVMEFREKQ